MLGRNGSVSVSATRAAILRSAPADIVVRRNDNVIVRVLHTLQNVFNLATKRDFRCDATAESLLSHVERELETVPAGYEDMASRQPSRSVCDG